MYAPVEAYWAAIEAHNYTRAYGYLAPGSISLTESEFVANEQQTNIQKVGFHGEVTSISGSSATVKIARLITDDQQYGCRTWTGSYQMTLQPSGWLIEHANLTPQSCSG